VVTENLGAPMPRRFDWNAVPGPLLRRLTRELGLTGGPVHALTGAYGTSPQVEFVRDAWPTLRDGWLARDTPGRRLVVQQLRERGLGDLTLPVGNREQQLAYLATCRNAGSLRQIVLSAFHELGERTVGTPVAPPAVIAPGLDGEIDLAWAEFQFRLETALRELREGYLFIGLPGSYPTGDPDAMPSFVQLEARGSRLHAEFAAEAFAYGRSYRLDPDQCRALVEQGWREEPDTADPAGDAGPVATGEFSLAVDREAASELALTIVRSIRGVLGVLHPSFLSPTGFWEDKDTQFERIDHGPGSTAAAYGSAGSNDEALGGSDDSDELDLPDQVDLEIHVVDNARNLRRMVDAALEPLLGGPPNHDADDDVMIECDHGTVYVSVSPEAPFLTMFCPLLRSVPGSPTTMKRLNLLNQKFRLVRLTWEGGVVMVTMDLWCAPFSPALVRQSVEAMMTLVDTHGPEIRLEVKGRPYVERNDQ
jgi:hypothetical protein